MDIDRELLAASKAWPVTEALRLLERVREHPPAKGYALFETGYGPSGLPHIGTFAEVFRTTLVRQAFARLSDLPTELVAFSDDMDGLRKVPDNVPNREMVERHLGRPLTAIPDPFGMHESFGAHMNARLRAFLDRFGFAYSFVSATECYHSGRFDAVLLRALERHAELVRIVTPILGPERAATYSPFLPISPKTGRVLQARIEELRPDDGTVIFRDEDGARSEVPVTGGRCKLQWRADWALRWTALEVDYEMSGKDLIDSVKLGSRICEALGGVPPQTLTYELFLDERGEKISKSRGNGLTIDEWLRYATPESLELFLFKEPRKAKRLHFDVIPRHVDEYESLLEAFDRQEPSQRLANPVHYIHDSLVPNDRLPAGLSFSMLLNLAAVVNADDSAVLWGFIGRYAPGVTPETSPRLAALVDRAVAYYQDFVRPAKHHRLPTDEERPAFEDLRNLLAGLPEESDGEMVQGELYAIGRRHGLEPLRNWFRALYEVLLGQSEGPRFGSFVAVYGIANACALVERALARPREAA